MSEKYYTCKQAAEEAGISIATISSAIRNKQLKASEIPSGSARGYQYRIAESDLLDWVENRKQRKTIIPNVTELTVDDLAEELLKRIQKAYTDGYNDGAKHAKEEFNRAFKNVKI